MIKAFALYTIFGLPVLAYFGMVTLSSFALTAFIPMISRRTKGRVKFIWHTRLAKISFALAVTHALLFIALYF